MIKAVRETKAVPLEIADEEVCDQGGCDRAVAVEDTSVEGAIASKN